MSVTRPYGADHVMVIAAVRYCLGRATYIVTDCADWLTELWPSLPESARRIIERDVETEFARDDRARAEGSKVRPLGWDCDRQQWERVRALWGRA